MRSVINKLGVPLALGLALSGVAIAGNSTTATVRVGVILVIPLQANMTHEQPAIQTSIGDGVAMNVPSQSSSPNREEIRVAASEAKGLFAGSTPEQRESIVLVRETFVAE